MARISLGQQEKVTLGNLDAKRDWGHAADYAEAMWSMLQQDQAEDFVIATGETHSVRSFVELSFKEIGVDIEWKGEGVNEKGYDMATGVLRVDVSEKYFRPTEVDLLLGNPAKAKAKLGWEPKTSMAELCKQMVASDIDLVKTGKDYM